jgi:hypothetical protein
MYQMQAVRSTLAQCSNHRKPFQQLHAVRCVLKTTSQIPASIVNNLMSPISPYKTSRYIIHLSFVGYVSWRTIFSIVSGKFFLAEDFHPL